MKISLKKSKGSYRHGNLREAILATSLLLIEKNGIEQLSIRDVAKRAGVTHQAPYRHFKDREALLAALAQDGYERLFLEMSNAIANSKDVLESLCRLGMSYTGWAIKHPDHFRLMFSQKIPEFETSDGLTQAANKMLVLVLSVVQKGQAAGLIKQDDTRAIARQLWACVHGATHLFIDEQFKPLKGSEQAGLDLVRDIVLNLINGIRPR